MNWQREDLALQIFCGADSRWLFQGFRETRAALAGM
jgi:hypothetical protein